MGNFGSVVSIFVNLDKREFYVSKESCYPLEFPIMASPAAHILQAYSPWHEVLAGFPDWRGDDVIRLTTIHPAFWAHVAAVSGEPIECKASHDPKKEDPLEAWTLVKDGKKMYLSDFREKKGI